MNKSPSSPSERGRGKIGEGRLLVMSPSPTNVHRVEEKSIEEWRDKEPSTAIASVSL